MIKNSDNFIEYLGKKFYIFFDSNNNNTEIFEEIFDGNFLEKSLEVRLKMDYELNHHLKTNIIVIPFNGGLHIAQKIYELYSKRNFSLRFLSIEDYSYVGSQKKIATINFLFDLEKRNRLIYESGIKATIPSELWLKSIHEVKNVDDLIVCDDVYDEGNSALGIYDFLKKAFNNHKINCFYQFHKIENNINKKNGNLEKILEKVKVTHGKFHSTLIPTENKWVGGCGADIGVVGNKHAGRNIQSLILRTDKNSKLYDGVLNQYNSANK